MRLEFKCILISAAFLLSAGLSLRAQQVSSPQSKSPSIAIKDAQSDRLRAATEQERKALARPETPQTPETPRRIEGRGGVKGYQLGAEQMSYAMVTRGADGKVKVECVDYRTATGTDAKRDTAAKQNANGGLDVQ